MKGLAIGRIVHYVGTDREHAPAIVTRVVDLEKGIINLTVFPDLEEPYFRYEVPYKETTEKASSWHWPEQA